MQEFRMCIHSRNSNGGQKTFTSVMDGAFFSRNLRFSYIRIRFAMAGGILSRCFHRGRVGGVVKRAAEIIHKCLGSISNKTASAFIYQEIIRSMHLKIDNKVALRYLLKRRGGCNQCNTVKNKQENGEHTSLKKISIYQLQLPTQCFNQRVEQQSRHNQVFSEQKLSSVVFKTVCQTLGQPRIDLFASHLPSQLPRYFTWKPDHLSQIIGAMQKDRSYQGSHRPYTL